MIKTYGRLSWITDEFLCTVLHRRHVIQYFIHTLCTCGRLGKDNDQIA